MVRAAPRGMSSDAAAWASDQRDQQSDPEFSASGQGVRFPAFILERVAALEVLLV